jgi:hypothetical protein
VERKKVLLEKVENLENTIKYLTKSVSDVKFYYWCRETVGVGTGAGFNASTMHQKTLITDPFGNTYKVYEVSLEVEVGGVVGLRCQQPSWDTDL